MVSQAALQRLTEQQEPHQTFTKSTILTTNRTGYELFTRTVIVADRHEIYLPLSIVTYWQCGVFDRFVRCPRHISGLRVDITPDPGRSCRLNTKRTRISAPPCKAAKAAARNQRPCRPVLHRWPESLLRGAGPDVTHPLHSRTVHRQPCAWATQYPAGYQTRL